MEPTPTTEEQLAARITELELANAALENDNARAKGLYLSTLEDFRLSEAGAYRLQAHADVLEEMIKARDRIFVWRFLRLLDSVAEFASRLGFRWRNALAPLPPKQPLVQMQPAAVPAPLGELLRAPRFSGQERYLREMTTDDYRMERGMTEVRA